MDNYESLKGLGEIIENIRSASSRLNETCEASVKGEVEADRAVWFEKQVMSTVGGALEMTPLSPVALESLVVKADEMFTLKHNRNYVPLLLSLIEKYMWDSVVRMLEIDELNAILAGEDQQNVSFYTDCVRRHTTNGTLTSSMLETDEHGESQQFLSDIYAKSQIRAVNYLTELQNSLSDDWNTWVYEEID